MKHLPQEQGSAGAVSSSLRPGAQTLTDCSLRGASRAQEERCRRAEARVQFPPVQPDTPADWLELLSAFTTRSSELIAAYTAAQIRKDASNAT